MANLDRILDEAMLTAIRRTFEHAFPIEPTREQFAKNANLSRNKGLA